MTVNTTNITSGPYTGNNTTDVYSYNFRVEDKTQVSVYETDADGVETQLVVDTDYTVNDLGNDAGGTITRAAGNLPDGYLWYIRSDYKDTQLTEFASQGGFLPAVHESAMDKITFLIQQLQDRLGRAVRVSDSYPEAPIITMPDPEAGKALVWNNDADGITNGPSASESAGASFVIETQTATEGQTVFVISKFTYVPGTGNLSVFINGVWQSDFIETDGSTATLTEGLTAGDEVSFISGALVSSAAPVDVSISRGTVSSAKAYTHTVGTEVVTQGYYVEGDGGGATYLVKTVIAYGGTPDGYGDHATDDGDFVLVLQNNDINVAQFGAVGDAVTDDLLPLQAALDAASALSISYSRNFVGAGGTIYPAVEIIWPSRKGYRLSASLTADVRSFNMTADGRCAVFMDDVNDYLFKFTGVSGRQSFKGFAFESTQAGCFDFEMTNVSSVFVWFDDCRFVTDAYGHESGIGVRYRNRSSALLFTRCYFNRIKHPVHNREGDFVTFDNNCWFGYPKNALFANKDAYIRNDNGFMRVNDCLFAGGPSAPTVGNGTETAYFNVGTESVSPDVTEVHGRLSITNTRIGYETGAGFLVNYFTPYHSESVGQQFRSGVVLENIQTAPRDDKLNNIEGTNTAGLVRLFTMPNQLSFNNVHGNNGLLGLLSAGSTTSLTTLRESVMSPVIYSEDLFDTKDVNSVLNYTANNVTAPSVYPIIAAPTPSVEENNRWLELFGKFNYFFNSDYTGSAASNPTINIDTYFNEFANPRGAIFKVYGGCYTSTPTSGNIGNISGTVTMHNDKGGDAITVYYDSDIDYTAQPEAIEVTPFFLVGGVTEQASVTAAEAADANLRIRIQHAGSPGVVNIRCQGLVVKPVSATFNNLMSNGMFQA